MRSLLGKIRAAAAVLLVLVVAGCSTIDPGTLVGPGPPTLKPAQAKTLSNAPIRGDAAIFAFQPMSGAPAEMIYALEDSIKAEALAPHLNLVPADDLTATYIVRGYISAVGDAHNVIMVYVWDIFDRTGTRVNRISGQEIASGSGSDPWAGVETKNMGAAARDTIDTLANWIRN